MSSAPGVTVQGKDGTARSLNRVVGAVLTQGVASGTSFGFVIVSAHSLSPSEMGYLLLAFSTVVFLTGLNQAYNVEPELVSHAHSDNLASPGLRVRAVRRTVLSTGAVSAVAVSTIWLLADRTIATTVTATAVLLPLWALLDANRAVRQAAGQVTRALLTDCVLLLATICGGYYLVGPGDPSATVALSVLAGAATLACATLLWPARTRTQTFKPFLLTIPRSQRLHLTAEYLSMQGANQAVLYSTTFYLPLATVAGFRSVQALFGPLNIFFTSIRIAATPIFARHLSPTEADERNSSTFLKAGAVVILAVSILGVIVAVAAGHLLGSYALGQTWATAEFFLYAVGAQYLALGAVNGCLVYLRATKSTAYSMRARVVQSMLVIAAGAAAWIWESESLLAWGIPAATAGSLVAWVGYVVAANRKRTRER